MKRLKRPRLTPFTLLAVLLFAAAITTLPACVTGTDSLTVYSGRSPTLVGPILADYVEETGIEVQVKYGSSAAIAATILEEGDRSPADVVFLQDPGYLGSLAHAGMLAELPDALLTKVDSGLPFHHSRLGGHFRAVPRRCLQHQVLWPGTGPSRLHSGIYRA